MKTRSRGPAELVKEDAIPRTRRVAAQAADLNPCAGPLKKRKRMREATEEPEEVTKRSREESQEKSPQSSPKKSPQKKEVSSNQDEVSSESPPLRLSDVEEENTDKYEPEALEIKPTSLFKMDSTETYDAASLEVPTKVLSKPSPYNQFIVDRIKVKPIVVEHSKKMCKSGRFWKSSRDRFSSLVTTKGLKSDLKKKNALRLELKKVKALENSIKEEGKMKKAEMKERRLENARRREINARKSEIVQELKNPAKIKKMKKKQLRMVAKRDLAGPAPVSVS